MARIRTIKPEFFTSEDIVSLTPLARLLYIALWCEADREGRLNWKPRTLKMKYLPAESCDVMPICDELVSANLVVPYIVDDEPYAVLPSFKKHQAINVREAQSSIPAPPDGVHVHARAKDAWIVDADTRVTVLARDAHRCVRCGSDEHLQIDHIFPKSMGGSNAITNLRVLCRSCNAARPVSGQGLIDDLAKDGLTLYDMQRTCMHVQGDGEGKGKEGKGREGKGKEGGDDARASSARPTRKCPPDFMVTAEMQAWAVGNAPLVDAAKATASFRDHTFKTAISDWAGAWRNWLRKDQEFAAARAGPANRPAGKHAGFQSMNYREGVAEDGSFV